jgi:hypothetical protein
MSTVEIKYLCTPHDGKPGESWEKFEGELLDVAAGKTDDRGWSLADAFTQVDEGSAGGPALPGGAAGQKAGALRRRRLKDSYSLLVVHELDEDYKIHLKQNFFQDGPGAFAYMQGECQQPADRLKLRSLNKDWDALDMLTDVGVSPNSVSESAKKIKAVNSKRPVASRKDQTECAERLLEMIFQCSKHFSTLALTEYNAPPANWQFTIAGGPAVGQRDFTALTAHFHALWKAAVDSKLPGFHARPPAAKPATPMRTTLEAGLLAHDGAGSDAERAYQASHGDFRAEAGSTDYFVPRSISPSRTLALLAVAGDDLSSRHGTVTTTDFGLLTEEECAACVAEGETIYVFDADNTGSVEISCNNCGGLAHIARVCPSIKRNRTLGYVIATLQSKLEKVGKDPPRRPPGRGQRPPFHTQPRRFQPARRSDGQRFSSQKPPRRRMFAAEEEGDDDDGDYSSASRAGSSSGSSSTARSEVLESAIEKPPGLSPIDEGKSAVTKPAPAVQQPLLFSDDQLFEQERCRVAVEGNEVLESPVQPRVMRDALPGAAGGSEEWSRASAIEVAAVADKHDTPQHGKPQLLVNTMLLSLSALIVAVLSVLLEGVERLRALCGVGVIVILVCLTGRVLSSPLESLSTPLVESLQPGREMGLISLNGGDGLFITVDSGATSTAIPEQRIGMLKKITNHNPNQKIWIANDKALEIVKVGEMDAVTNGYVLIPETGVQPRDWKQKPVRVTVPSSRTIVVRGLGPNTLLFSVRGLKNDGVKTFVNDDNSIQREDCLLLKDGVTVVPFVSSHAYEIKLSAGESAKAAADVTSRRSPRMAGIFHSGLGHAGQQRMKSSNIVMDGVDMSDLEHDPTTCVGCRLGNTGNISHWVKHRRAAQAGRGSSREGFTHFGQQIDTDICTGFKPSFPHLFTCMLNFNERYTIEKWLYFMRHGESAEICSSLEHLHSMLEPRLPDGKIGRWVTDNSKSFLGHETHECAESLVQRRGYSIPNDSDSLPVPERNWGVIERMMRSMHAGAADPNDPNDKGAPECLWTWAAQQSNLLLYYLSTAAHDPPMSPYQFVTKNKEPVDLSWARVMFCDVTITVAKRDIDGKVGMHSADAVHLGYDPRRNCHFCFCESLQRLSSFTVKEWREDSFILCKRISADTPVEYFEAHDLPYSNVTSQLVPHRHTARARRELGMQTRSGFRILVVFHREREHSLMAFLRSLGHAVKSRDFQDGCDLLLTTEQDRVHDELSQYDFCFLCPPCTSASIAFDPPLRLFPDETSGVKGLISKHQTLVNEHNQLFDFTAEVTKHCDMYSVQWALESCASRRRNNKANWPRYHRNAFIWDYPPIERIFSTTTARTRCAAQCQFQAPWQKYTDLGSSGGANETFDKYFLGADCSCSSHAIVLKGYDEHGIARTSVAAEYTPGFASAISHAINDTCRAGKEGASEDGWEASLDRLDRAQLCDEMALSLLEPEGDGAPVTYGLTRAEIQDIHSQAHRERTDVEPDMEIYLEASDNGYVLIGESAYRVSEVGSELSKIKTVADAKASKFWPLFKAAMEGEIKGKMENAAWIVVERPTGHTVHKSRWVFAIKLNDDNSINVVKARFVGCGYSQIQGKDYSSVFAATLPGVSFRILLCCIADEDLETDHIDAVKAFTQAGIDATVYVESAEGFTADGLPPSKSRYCLLLEMALEGIKQGANLWFGLNKAAWLRLGCKSWMGETNLYYHPELRARVGVFADDTLCGYPREKRDQYLAMKREYSKIIKIGSSDTISPVLKFTGVQIDRDRRAKTITIHQKRYIEQMVESLKQEGITLKQYDTPHGSTKEERLAFDKVLENKDSPSISNITFLKLMGKLVWPSSMTRLDISMPVSTLCSCVSDARQVHYDWGLVIAGYLSSHADLGITYGGSLRIPYGLSQAPVGFYESHGLYTAHDSSWGTRPKPLGGYVIMYMNGAVDWSAKLVKIVPDSSCEAETAVASFASKGTCFIRGLLRFHQRPVAASTPMLGDNEAMHTLVTNEGATYRTRYYERATLLIKRAVLMLLLHPLLVATNYMVADMFTKALEKSTFVRFRNVMMNCNSSARDTLQKAASSLHGEARRLADRLLRQL